eukprot:473376-Prorocentrum_minimum.AAC.1
MRILWPASKFYPDGLSTNHDASRAAGGEPGAADVARGGQCAAATAAGGAPRGRHRAVPRAGFPGDARRAGGAADRDARGALIKPVTAV